MYVIATAGHVDHGKSTLIRSLTGMEPDRWAEERQRGMTIDLGYAWTSLSDGTPVAFVDVPGHQRFITNMLAGIGPVPAVLLVVAADEGWCRQTAEHLAALDALGITHGVLAVTRADLGDAELAIAEARDYLAGTSLENVEAVTVSPVANLGMDELRSAIERMTATLPEPPLTSTRLWVDRVFTIHGAGTVVTGTIGSGRVAVGDELVVAPSGKSVRVRSVETLKHKVDSVTAVARVALNLRGIKVAELHRGDALIRPGEWTITSVIDVRLQNMTGRLPSSPILHAGSAAVTAHVRLFDAHTARLTLGRPLPLHVGERAILRDPGQQHVVAGVVVLDVLPPALTRRGSAQARARELQEVTAEPDLRSEVARRLVVRRSALQAAGVSVPSPLPGDVAVVGDWLIEPARWEQWRRELLDVADAWATAHPLQLGMPQAAAAQALQLPDEAILGPLVATEPTLTSDGDGVHRIDVSVALPDDVRRALDELRQRLTPSPFDALGAPELAAIGLTERHLAVATKRDELVRIASGIYLRPDALSQAADILAQLPQPFTLSEARQALGTTRRVAVPLLEMLDRKRVTRRVDSQRRIMNRETPGDAMPR